MSKPTKITIDYYKGYSDCCKAVVGALYGWEYSDNLSLMLFNMIKSIKSSEETLYNELTKEQ